MAIKKLYLSIFVFLSFISSAQTANQLADMAEAKAEKGKKK